MIESLRQRAWRRLTVIFPERQIYLRSDGRVQFYTFSSQFQTVVAAGGLLFLGWVAFTSVNVIFKDRIFAAKERHFEQMQAFYETRIADLQLSYDELNSSLVLAQDRFQDIAEAVEAKQQALAAVIEHKKQLLDSLGKGPVAERHAQNDKTGTVTAFDGVSGVGGAFDAMTPHTASSPIPPVSTSNAAPATTPASADVSFASPAVRPTFLTSAMQRIGTLFRHRASAHTANLNHPILKEADAQSARILKLGLGESALLAQASQDVNKQTMRLTGLLRGTGIDTKGLINRLPPAQAQGGPFIPLALPADASDDNFNAGVADAVTAVAKLGDVVRALNAIPLLAPTDTASVSSEFGARVDPFNERLAFHSGVDFSGPKGADVRATGSGVVVFAGARGEYGNTVEIDHGHGILTRYGHLAKILATPGTPVEPGAVIGRLGSTGRSTGPHVHYEVWYDKAVKNPEQFIKAGRDVLKN